MENSIAVIRGKAFIEKFTYNSSGFWLSTEQLRILANDLEKQGSSGVGFLVGYENEQLGVEILPLSGDLTPYSSKNAPKYNFKLGPEITITETPDIRGYIETDIEIIHNNQYSHEAQRFPPPEP